MISVAKFKTIVKGNLVVIRKKQRGKEQINDRELQIFEENLIPGLFRPKLEKNKLIYTAPLGTSLEKYIKTNLTIHKLYSVVAQITELVKRIEKFNFNKDKLVLDIKLIYVKEMTGEIFVIYEPIVNKKDTVNLFAFLEELMEMIHSENRTLLEECRQFASFLSNPEHFKVDDIEAFILQHYPQIYQQILRADTGKSGFMTASKLSYQNHYHPPEANSGEVGTTLLTEEQGTTLLSEEEGTTLLQNLVSARLVRRSNGEEKEIHDNDFHIGKGIDADYCVAGNNAISREHAIIYYVDGEFKIQDANSTNHSYVNGIMVQDGMKELLHNGDVIKLANEEFDFYII